MTWLDITLIAGGAVVAVFVLLLLDEWATKRFGHHYDQPDNFAVSSHVRVVDLTDPVKEER